MSSLLFSQNYLDKSSTRSGRFLNFRVHDGTIKKMIEKMKKKRDFRVKTRKGSLEQKRENFPRLMGKANQKMKGQQPGSI